jgi:16S rRNA (cytidine1402-2'-O)-methyltransferase
MPEGSLYLVGTPIGNLGDISQRALETLRRVDMAYAEDTRHTAILFGRFGIDTPLRSLHEHNETARSGEVIEHLRAGRDLALVSDAGTPAVSDPGSRVVQAVLGAGLSVVAVPGPSAVTAALAVSGLQADRFVFLGFSPRKGRHRSEWMEQVVGSQNTVVVFESARRVERLLEEWKERGLGGRRCVVCRELTKVHEEIRHGTVADLVDYYRSRDVRGEVTIVVEGRTPGEEETGTESELEAARRIARELARTGSSTQEIVRRLQDELAMPRNAAYGLALEVERER